MIQLGLSLAVIAAAAAAATLPPQSSPVPASTAPGGNAGAAVNVNSRYIVESAEITPDPRKLSGTLRQRISDLKGTRFDQEAVDAVAGKIRQELRNWNVVVRIARGEQPEQVRVVFEVSRKYDTVDVVIPRLIYHSKQNFSFGGDVTVRPGADFFLSSGILTDNDELAERYSGIRAGLGRENMFGGHLRLGVRVESWRSQWNPSVTNALANDTSPDTPGIYRTRVHLEPTATIAFTRDLMLQLGVSMQRLEMQYPTSRHELSSAAVSTLRFQRRWDALSGFLGKQELEASYALRAAARTLSSDFLYNRHSVQARYAFGKDRETLIASFQAGTIGGTAPLFERFMLGNSRTLRGWNRYDVAPFGGDRMVHGSLEYRHNVFRAIYDTGSVWQRAGDAKVRHSLAVGLRSGSVMSFSFLVAFPLREGRIEPVFITGIDF
ncbi:MAG: hypothetical protein FJW39_21070 [Acidobacteria bacterium]|nr:hypothetical protein [Acidobacteriota bacterium]